MEAAGLQRLDLRDTPEGTRNPALDTMLAEHTAWLEQKGGRQARLAMADLRGVDLQGANLSPGGFPGGRVLDRRPAPTIRESATGCAQPAQDLASAPTLQRTPTSKAPTCASAQCNEADLQAGQLEWRPFAQGAIFEAANLERAVGRAGEPSGTRTSKNPPSTTRLLWESGLDRRPTSGWRIAPAPSSSKRGSRARTSAWRKLDQADMRGADLRGASLAGATREGADLRGAAARGG